MPTQGKPLTETTTASKEAPSTEITPVMGGIAGGILGAGTGTQAAYAQAKFEAAKRGLEYLAGHPVPVGAPEQVAGQTPGGKWGAKTGYGMGEGTVQEASSRYQRAMPQGKVSGPYAKKYGPAMPGESREIGRAHV